MQAFNRPSFLLVVLFALSVISSGVYAAENPVDQALLHPAIPLLDEAGNHVRESGKPYSPKTSCGSSSCHDYDKITHAYHFETGRDEASDEFGAKRGLPHLVSPGYFGGYTCMGGSNPEVLAKKENATTDDFADQGSAGLIKRCIGCHTGGGWMEKDRNGKRYDEANPSGIAELDGDYFNRGSDDKNNSADVNTVSRWDWNKSGVVEADCMLCHADFSALQKFDSKLGANDGSDDSDSAFDHFKDLRNNILVKNGNYFRYAPTAILEFLSLTKATPEGEDNTGDTSLLTFEREIKEGSTDPDYSLVLGDDNLPVLNWNADAFDANGKALIPMLRFPGNDNCMMCHRTSNSRRGFYGFGEAASATYADDQDGPLVEDYKDDVHKGKTWTEPNGETRSIENCNACHSQNYFKKSFENVDLNADHNFLKGNSDMDVRNDLDFNANAKTCEYCHNDAPAPSTLAIPSGHADMLSAHREIWKANGDMNGYPQDKLTKITKTHLDVVACQTCHITDKKSGSRPIQIMYRYRAEASGNLKIVPYNPRLRYYWKDQVSGRVLTKTERNSVFEMREENVVENGEEKVKKYGAIVNPAGDEIGRVTVRLSHGSWRFGDPQDYAGVMSLKNAYDSLLAKKGLANPDTIMVWTESNEYIISHNARPSPDSVPCGDCHNKKESGSFSSLVSTDGIFGEENIKTVTQLADPRLFTEGVVVFDFPYMKMDASGKVVENVSDILYATKVDPSMTALRSASAPIATGVVKRMPAREGLLAAGIEGTSDIETLSDLFRSEEMFLYRPNYGNRTVRAVSLMPEANSHTELLFPTYQMSVALAESDIALAAANAGFGELSSQVFSIRAIDKTSRKVAGFSGNPILVKLPYEGRANNLDEIKVIHSTNGTDWTEVVASKVQVLKAHSDEVGAESIGYVAFLTDHLSHYAIVNNSSLITARGIDTGAPQESTGSSGGGSFSYLLFWFGFLSFFRLVYMKKK